MWFLLLLCAALFEQVITQADDPRLYLKDGDGPCEGYVKIYKGDWGYLGDSNWNRTTEEVVCRSTHCGEPVPDAMGDVSRKTDGKTWLNEVECDGTEDQLWKCKHPGWGISFYQKPTVKKVVCSNKIKIHLEGDTCAGAVRYSTDDGKTPSGYLCFDKNNTRKEAVDNLCESLGCGKSHDFSKLAQMTLEGPSTFMKIKCPENMNSTYLWQCVTQEKCEKPAHVVCTDYKRVQLRGNSTNACSGRLQMEKGNDWTDIKLSDLKPTNVCSQMHCGDSVNITNNETQLKCSDTVEVVLKDNTTSCYGYVHIKVNNKDHPVCGTRWSKENSEMVCRELKCGKAVNTDFVPSKSSMGWIMDMVECKGKESSLWHCKAKRDKTKKMSCQLNAYAMCEGSVDARLVDGPGKCAGRVEIQFEGKWQNVDKQKWEDINSNVVCQQLKCGDAREPNSAEKFSQGSSDFLQKNIECKVGVKHISECKVTNLATSPRDKEALGIICEEHKVVFLDGKSSCSGKVRIEKGNVISWLSGSNETWNQETANTVCGQMHCGEAQSFNHKPNSKKVLIESYKCPSNATSLFDCETAPLTSDSNASIATVTCSEKINITLTEECWGRVNVCMRGKCGGVCRNTWTDSMSERLCKELKCGNIALKPINQQGSGKVIIKSAHSPKNPANLTSYNFVINDVNDRTCSQKPAYVVCSGSIKPKLDTFGDKCSGNVLLSYENQLLPVCKEALEDKTTQNAICKELECGVADNSTDYIGPPPETNHISNLEYESNLLKTCEVPPNKQPCRLGGLQCSEWRKITLSDTCTGAVYVKSKEENIVAVGAEGLPTTVGEKFCKDLKCGPFKSVTQKKANESLWKKSFNCTDVGEEGKIWDCEKPQASTQENQLVIECEEKPKITLSGQCHGKLKINGLEVCDSQWDDKNSQIVCQEQSCGNAIVGKLNHTSPGSGNYHHVHCEDHHYKLGQCKRVTAPCRGKLVFIHCVGNVKFRLKQQTCGGQIEVKYRDMWEKVCDFPQHFQKTLCEMQKCGEVLEPQPKSGKKEVYMETSVECKEGTEYLNYCVLQKDCTKQPTELYCKGYVFPKLKPKKDDSFPVVSVIVGLGFLLVVVVLTVIFVRMYIVRRAKNVSLRMFPRKEVEFESGDMDDFHNKANEMEDFRRGRFRSDSEVIAEQDARSTSSYPYDDIDEMEEGRPLTSQADTDAASGDYMPMPDSAPDESADGVTYEVDDPQENYDDIEASPEVTQTKAQVYNTPKSPPESVAVAPPGLRKGDEDYLVPGQDG